MKAPLFFPEPDKIGSGWCVVAIWPNGHQDMIGGLGDETEANRWINHHSRRWITEQSQGSQRITPRVLNARARQESEPALAG